MFEYFFTYKTELPADVVGWQHYDLAHLCFLIFFAIATIVMVRIYRGCDERLQKRIRIAYVVIMLVMEILKDAVCFFTLEVWDPDLFPLHMCGISIIISAIHVIKPNKWTGTLLYCLCMPGAFMALLFSDWIMYPVLSYFNLHSFFIHFLMFSFPVLLIGSGEIRPRLTDLWRAVIFLVVVIPPIYFINQLLDTNFFFLNLAAPGSPLEPLQVLGMPGYLFGFMGLVVVFWIILYLPWMIKTLLEKRATAKSTQGEN
ncbi:MAG TPA: TIGR02206 family membrane protein [Coriobacteriia bacterium]|nr:TIGR02206 family membrane protein [Coriobacteriia bacterium]